MSAARAENGMDHARRLMMRALDEELSQNKAAELAGLLDADPQLQDEWKRLARVKQTANAMKLRTPPDQVWEDYMNNVYRRVERGIGWIFVSVGAIVLLSYGLWTGIGELLGDSTLPWYVKGAILALLVGLVVLVVSVAREKFFVHRRDPFKDVER